MADLFVTNFNKNHTGVSSTVSNVLRQHLDRYDLRLVGHGLPGCPEPITTAQARRETRLTEKPFAIWHVRRNTEMRAALWARDVLRLPIRTVFTSAAKRRHSAFPRWLISRMDAVIATSDKAALHIGDNLRATVPHGVDCDQFRPAEDRAAAWAELGYGGTRGIANIGRLRSGKGTDIFVKAMMKALPHLPGVTALAIGKTSQQHESFIQDLKNQVREAGLADRILFPGEIPSDDLPCVIRALSLVMQVPRFEPFGLVPLEGMASGVPFVGSRTGHYAELSAEGRAGTIVPTEEIDQAAEAAKAILTDDARHETMARFARDFALEKYSSAREAAGVAEVYEALWAQGR